MYIGALYHPPKPIYKKSVPLDLLERTVDMITLTEPHALLILDGDMNALTETEIVHRAGLIPSLRSLLEVTTSPIDYLSRSLDILILKSSTRKSKPTTRLSLPHHERISPI